MNSWFGYLDTFKVIYKIMNIKVPNTLVYMYEGIS